ncbi:DUF6221 family protein [Nocardia nova]|uniref:DUF6221 family protein n=1 Tax=Nocardia nova TaxID=37330 RepID=UPI003799A9E8
MTIVEFIEARLAEDEQIAQSAIDPERPGTHWCWEDGERNPLQPGVEVEGLDTRAISLRTVEEYPTRHVGPLPAFILCQVEARQQGGLWHIARHDPARVLRQCAALRWTLDLIKGNWEDNLGSGDRASEADRVNDLAMIAAIWSGHPDFRQEWAA